VSSKKKRRTQEFRQREKKREEQIRLKRDWVCPKCHEWMPGFSPVCLCGHIRMRMI